MYPPQDDSERKCEIPGVRMFRTRGHRVWIGNNGAIRIATAGAREERIVLDKAGKDGGRCPAT